MSLAIFFVLTVMVLSLYGTTCQIQRDHFLLPVMDEKLTKSFFIPPRSHIMCFGNQTSFFCSSTRPLYRVDITPRTNLPNLIMFISGVHLLLKGTYFTNKIVMLRNHVFF